MGRKKYYKKKGFNLGEIGTKKYCYFPKGL